MLPPELQSIANELLTRFQQWVEQDTEGAALPDLLTAEEEVSAFVRHTGNVMLQAFADIRETQAKATRQRCSCGRRTEIHHRTTWTRETLLGPVLIRDPYAYCRTCGESDRPLHAWLGLPVPHIRSIRPASAWAAVARRSSRHPTRAAVPRA